mmetsp:Transcript_102162/g.159368  ORF Transcript_102162/g.159368 Transcript_102162/m.159368 type:complete len:618 (+) Transcript_102162:49-1902(+)
MTSRKVVLSDLPTAEKERFYEFLVAHKVEFIADAAGGKFLAKIRVVPPEPSTARITGRSRQVSKPSMRTPPPGARAKAKAQAAVGAAPANDVAATLKAAQSVLRRRYTRFCTILPALTQPPKAVRRAALLRFAEEVYDARYEKDSAYIKSEAVGETVSKLPQAFPDFVFEFAAKRYGLKQLVSNNCWGMVSSVELLRGQHVGVDLFGKFLEESYDATDLLFFLFTRNAIERVMSQTKTDEGDSKRKKKPADEEKKSGAEDDEAVAAAGKNQKSSTAERHMDAKQMVQVVRMAIDGKNGQTLRDSVIKKLDAAMAARTEGSAKKVPTLEPDRLLSIATEEYHNSRDIKDIATSTSLADERIQKQDSQLTPELRKEVRQVTRRLMESLQQQGEGEVDQKQVYEWALQVTLRRHKLGDFLDQETAPDLASMDLAGMQKAAMALMEQPGLGGQAFVPSDVVLKLSPEEFESNLEGNVRQLLLNATSELVTQAVASVSVFKNDEHAATSLRSALISEFAPTADVIMEAIVSKDYKRWLDTLGAVETPDHRKNFEKLHDEFQQALNSDISASVVQQICRAVVSADELHGMVKARAQELALSGSQQDDGLAEEGPNEVDDEAGS